MNHTVFSSLHSSPAPSISDSKFDINSASCNFRRALEQQSNTQTRHVLNDDSFNDKLDLRLKKVDTKYSKIIRTWRTALHAV